MWAWLQKEPSWKTISRCLYRRWKKTPAHKHKKLERAKLLLWELKAGTAEREFVFFLMNKCSQLKRLLTIRTTEFTQNLQQTLMTPWEQFFSNNCRASQIKYWKSSCFSRSKGLGSTQMAIITIFWFQHLKAGINTSKISILPSNKMEHHPHTSRKNQSWCQHQAKICFVAHPDVYALKTPFRSKWAKIPQETLRASDGNFRERIKRLIKRKVHYIENK